MFIGTGEHERDEVLSEFLDIFILPGYESDVLNMLSIHSVSNMRWDFADFRNVKGTSFLIMEFLPKMRSANRIVRVRHSGYRYWLDLPPSWGEYLERLKSSDRRKINLSRNRLEERDSLAYVPDAREATTISESFETLTHLHGDRWNSKGKRGVFSSSKFSQFHLRLLNKYSETLGAKISFLTMNSKPLAVLYTFCQHRTTYYYQGGFDSISAKKFSPGRAMLTYAIENAIETKMQVFDFLMSRKKSYKRHYGCNTEEVFNVSFHNPSFRSRVARVLLKIQSLITDV